MRVLCLHGAGSSGAILERQMSNLRRELDPCFELVFVDGPFECGKGPGVSQFQQGPFYSHTEGYSPCDIERAVEHLSDVLEEEGPFDGIFGFSQGAALTLSYFYHHQQQDLACPPSVKFACLFSTAMPLSSDACMGEAIITNLRALEFDMTSRELSHGGGLLGVAELEFIGVMQQTVVDAARHDAQFPWADMDVYRYGQREAIPRVMYPALLRQKIQVPTVHVWGQNDHRYMIKMAELARSICDESKARTVLHGGLHDIPKKQNEIKAVLRTIDWVIGQA